MRRNLWSIANALWYNDMERLIKVQVFSIFTRSAVTFFRESYGLLLHVFQTCLEKCFSLALERRKEGVCYTKSVLVGWRR